MMSMTEQHMSDYTPGKSVREVATDWLRRYQDDGDVNSESVYGSQKIQLVRLTLAGGGPSAIADFEFDEDDEVWDGEPLRATFTYSEGWGVYESIDLGADEAAQLWSRLTRSPDEGGE